MTRVWQWNRPVTVREVLEDLHKERSIAYTTVMTVLDNLHQKGWVRREVVGRAYRYTAVSTRAAYSAALMNEAWAQSDNPAAALVAFFGMMSPEQREALNDAIRIVQRDPQEEPSEGAAPARSEVREEGTAQEPPQSGGNGGQTGPEGRPRDDAEGRPEAAAEARSEEPGKNRWKSARNPPGNAALRNRGNALRPPRRKSAAGILEQRVPRCLPTLSAATTPVRPPTAGPAASDSVPSHVVAHSARTFRADAFRRLGTGT